MSFELNNASSNFSLTLYPVQSNSAVFWNPRPHQLYEIMDYLYNNDHNIFQAISTNLMNADPQKAILSLRVYPIDFKTLLHTDNYPQAFKLYGKDVPYQNYVVNTIPHIAAAKDNILIGQLDIPYFENEDSFLSYEPYSKYYLYLPFAPLVELNSKRVVGKRVFVYGLLNLYEGTMTYSIEISEQEDDAPKIFLEQISTKICVDIPLYSSNTNQVLKDVFLSLINGSMNLAGGIANENASAVIKAIGGTATSIMGVEFGSSTLLRANADILGKMLNPYNVTLIRFTPKVKYHLNDAKYNHLYGVPTRKIGKIKDFGGFTQVKELHSYSFTGVTQKEIDEIETLLKQGIRAGNSQATLSITYNAPHTNWYAIWDTIQYGLPFTNSFTITSGYQLDNIQVLMGGNDITSTAVSGNQISIASVTGNVIINITTSKIPVYYTITYTNLVGATLSNMAVQVEEGSNYTNTLTPIYSSGYYKGSFIPTITMGGVPLSNVYMNGNINIPNVQGNIVISGTLPQSSKLNSDTWTPKSTTITMYPNEPISNLTGEIYVGTTQCAMTSLVIDNSGDIMLNDSFIYGTANISGVGSNLLTGVNVGLYVTYLDAQDIAHNLGFMTSLHLSDNVDWTNYGDLLEWLDLNFNKVV